MVVEQNHGCPSIFALLVIIFRQPAFDGCVLDFRPIWSIGVFLYRMLEVLKLFGRSVFEMGVT